jgi:hypothetical protein
MEDAGYRLIFLTREQLDKPDFFAYSVYREAAVYFGDHVGSKLMY